jgi:hypothetical protein
MQDLYESEDGEMRDMAYEEMQHQGAQMSSCLKT